jgi:hypothetical protein
MPVSTGTSTPPAAEPTADTLAAVRDGDGAQDR